MIGAQQALSVNYIYISSYRQVKPVEHGQEITAFTHDYSSFQFSVMTFRLLNAPAMFQRMATELRGNLDALKVYIDDVVIYFN